MRIVSIWLRRRADNRKGRSQGFEILCSSSILSSNIKEKLLCYLSDACMCDCWVYGLARMVISLLIFFFFLSSVLLSIRNNTYPCRKQILTWPDTGKGKRRQISRTFISRTCCSVNHAIISINLLLESSSQLTLRSSQPNAAVRAYISCGRLESPRITSLLQD